MLSLLFRNIFRLGLPLVALSCLRSFPAADYSALLLLFAGSGSGSSSAAIAVGTPAALYPNNGANWNYYVKRDGTNALNASDTACAGTEIGGYSACIHGGEMRAVSVAGRTGCAGLTARDSLAAFQWRCDESTGSVRFVSTGLLPGKFLVDLVDTTAPGWLSNSLIVSENGVDTATTESALWWTNPVTLNPATGSLSAADTVNVFTINPAGAFTIGNDRISFAGARNITLSGPGTNTNFILATGRKFLWIEGLFDLSGDQAAIDFDGTNFSVVRGVTVQDALNGPALRIQAGSRGNLIAQARIANTNHALGVNTSPWNTFRNLTISNSQASYGIRLQGGCENSVFQNVLVQSTAGDAINIQSHAVVLMNATAAFASNQAGITIDGSVRRTFVNVALANNDIGLRLVSNGNRNTVLNLASAHNTAGGNQQIMDNIASYLYFTGRLKTGTADCSDLADGDGGVISGLDNTCQPANSSDATVTTGVSLAASFVGKVAVNDSANSSTQTAGTAAYAAITDWTRFEHAYRAFGIDNVTAFPATIFRGPCAAGTCRIWDWSLSSADTVLRETLPLPTGNDIAYHVWDITPTDLATCQTINGAVFSGASVCDLPPFINHGGCAAQGGTNGAGCYTKYLRNAIELVNDGFGNDNGLCESGERCLYTPNIGAYQGHGDLVSAGTFTSGSISGVTLLRHATNGR